MSELGKGERTKAKTRANLFPSSTTANQISKYGCTYTVLSSHVTRTNTPVLAQFGKNKRVPSPSPKSSNVAYLANATANRLFDPPTALTRPPCTYLLFPPPFSRPSRPPPLAPFFLLVAPRLPPLPLHFPSVLRFRRQQRVAPQPLPQGLAGAR